MMLANSMSRPTPALAVTETGPVNPLTGVMTRVVEAEPPTGMSSEVLSRVRRKSASLRLRVEAAEAPGV